MDIRYWIFQPFLGGGVFDPPGPKVGPINNANDNSILISHMENLEVIYG